MRGAGNKRQMGDDIDLRWVKSPIALEFVLTIPLDVGESIRRKPRPSWERLPFCSLSSWLMLKFLTACAENASSYRFSSNCGRRSFENVCWTHFLFVFFLLNLIMHPVFADLRAKSDVHILKHPATNKDKLQAAIIAHGGSIIQKIPEASDSRVVVATEYKGKFFRAFSIMRCSNPLELRRRDHTSEGSRHCWYCQSRLGLELHRGEKKASPYFQVSKFFFRVRIDVLTLIAL